MSALHGDYIMDARSRFRGALVGLACGDAIGTAVEFKHRGTFVPVKDMIGGGPFHLKPGEWTDDTSMALCLATSLIESNGFDPHDQMERYCRWMDTGYLSSNGICFDIGRTIQRALLAFRQTGESYCGPTEKGSAGNGCLMRLAPVPMYFHGNRRDAIDRSADSARTTHGAQECIDASRIFGSMIYDALSGEPKDQILFGQQCNEDPSPSVTAILHGEYREKSGDQIRSSGYVVESLEAALWCFLHTNSYAEAILRAANLGDDADTTAAICGQIAGAYYGEAAIPIHWRKQLVMSNQINSIADLLLDMSPGTKHK